LLGHAGEPRYLLGDRDALRQVLIILLDNALTHTPDGTDIVVTSDAAAAVAGADVLCTDVWVSMGMSGAEQRLADLAAYALDDTALSVASPDATVLHCLPAHRGEEISASAIDGPQSAVWDEAENRLHAQKALLTWLLAQG